MRELPIFSDDGKIDGLAPYETNAIMLYPEDPKKQKQIMLSFAKTVPSEMTRAGYSHDQATYLLGLMVERYGGFEEFGDVKNPEDTRTDAIRRSWKGTIAGKILESIIYLDQFAPPSGVRRAIDLVKEEIKDEEKEGFSTSERHIYNSWKEYKNVSHLWAANSHWQNSGKAERPFPFVSDEELKYFLAIGDWFYRKGIEVKSASIKTRAFSPKDPWLPPPGLDLPSLNLNYPRNLKADALAAKYERK